MNLIAIYSHAVHAPGHRSSPHLKLLKPDRSTPHQPLGLRWTLRRLVVTDRFGSEAVVQADITRMSAFGCIAATRLRENYNV